MSQRDNVFEKFGPILLEALLDNMLEEVNLLRVHLGQPPRTKESFLGSTHNHMVHLTDYDWMELE